LLLRCCPLSLRAGLDTLLEGVIIKIMLQAGCAGCKLREAAGPMLAARGACARRPAGVDRHGVAASAAIVPRLMCHEYLAPSWMGLRCQAAAKTHCRLVRALQALLHSCGFRHQWDVTRLGFRRAIRSQYKVCTAQNAAN
jgi:hypothetical protein